MKKFSKKVIPVNYFWLSIEWADAVGKTKLLEEIEKFLRNQKKIKFKIIKEFSNSSLGNLIKDTVNKKKFFSLGDRFHYPFAETLLLCADFVY